MQYKQYFCNYIVQFVYLQNYMVVLYYEHRKERREGKFPCLKSYSRSNPKNFLTSSPNRAAGNLILQSKGLKN
nr:MAG TPA: hypothetical protein [Caudoviricetes sp.]